MIALFNDLLSTPTIAYVLLAVLAIEAVALFWFWSEKGIGIPPTQVVTFLGSGAAFSLALWCVLIETATFWLAVCLFVAFVFHIVDMKLRWTS